MSFTFYIRWLLVFLHTEISDQATCEQAAKQCCNLLCFYSVLFKCLILRNPLEFILYRKTYLRHYEYCWPCCLSSVFVYRRLAFLYYLTINNIIHHSLNKYIYILTTKLKVKKTAPGTGWSVKPTVAGRGGLGRGTEAQFFLVTRSGRSFMVTFCCCTGKTPPYSRSGSL